MSKSITINRFDGGWAQSKYERGTGRFAACKGFDILTLPNQLYPTRSGTTDTAGTGIGNLLIGSDGYFYGLGSNGGNATLVYYKVFSGTSWASLSNCNTGSASLNFELFVEYPDVGGGLRELVAANFASVSANNSIKFMDKENAVGTDEHVIADFTSVSQGVVHPQDDILYIPYTKASGNTQQAYIAKYNGALGVPSLAGAWTDTALTLPKGFVVSAIAPYGKYLAIACVPAVAYTIANTGKTIAVSANANSFNSIVYLWDRDTSLTTVSEKIDWGTGILQVLNSFDGYLFGISNFAGISQSIKDGQFVQIKAYNGGQPQLVAQLNADSDTNTAPTASINPLVNFIYRNRLFFSVNLTGNTNTYGIWSVGKSNLSGRYAVSLERGVTSDNSETGVLAAVASGDIFVSVYNSNGTMSQSQNNSSNALDFNATSYYESVVNPEMPELDYVLPKQLMSVGVMFKKLSSAGQIVLKYKVDGGSFTTIATYTSASASGNDTLTRFERTKDASGAEFTKGSEYEFRVESTGGAVITGLVYKYNVHSSSLI